jgi:hypothetical protein
MPTSASPVTLPPSPSSTISSPPPPPPEDPDEEDDDPELLLAVELVEVEDPELKLELSDPLELLL